jgi:hypothetical protein
MAGGDSEVLPSTSRKSCLSVRGSSISAQQRAPVMGSNIAFALQSFPE